jgi:hypothetical protein
MVVCLVHPRAWPEPSFSSLSPQVGVGYARPSRDEACQAPTSDNVVMVQLFGGAFASTVEEADANAANVAAELVKAKSCTIGSEALCWDHTACRGSRSWPLEPRSSAPLIGRICAISHSWTERLRWRGCCARPGILLNEHIGEDGAIVFAHACQLGADGVRFEADRRHLPVRTVPRVDQGPQIPPTSPCSGSAARIGTGDQEHHRRASTLMRGALGFAPRWLPGCRPSGRAGPRCDPRPMPKQPNGTPDKKPVTQS